MNAPSRPASIEYSGQWARRASTADDARCWGNVEPVTVSARLAPRALINKLCSALFMESAREIPDCGEGDMLRKAFLLDGRRADAGGQVHKGDLKARRRRRTTTSYRDASR